MKMRALVLCLVFAGSAMAGEYAVLASGARLYADRHEADAAKVRLFHGGGFVELDAPAAKAFEKEETISPPAAAPVPVIAAPPAVPDRPTAPSTPLELAYAAADKYGLPRDLVRTVMAVESGFVADAISPKGAIGLMQLMPQTARDLGVNPNDPAQNVDGGVRYLRDLLVKYDGGLRHALAAYNAGPAAVDRYNGVPPYAETINYVVKIERKLKSGR